MCLLTLTIALAGIGGCRSGSRGAERLAEDSSAAQDLNSNLTFNNITLEQADEQGKRLWQVEAEQATYSSDQKIAQVTNPDGELYQDGELAFRVKAQRGEVRQDGERILLKGQIVATDVKSGAILRGDELVWTPEDNVLVVRNNLRGTHPQFRATAREARVYNRERYMELEGQVVATTQDPNLRLNAEKMVWRIDDEKVNSDRPIQVERLNGQQVTDRANGNQADVDLETKIVQLRQNAQLVTVDPPLQVNSNLLVWNLANETVTSEQPVTIVQRQQQVTATADRGRMDLERRIAYLTANVRAVAQRNRSQLSADSLTWNVSTEQVNAEGNVVYQQADPPLTSRGPRAVGRLQNQTIVVSGGRVVTEIIPDQADLNQLAPERAN
ncbi:LPS export ABC transporter periplasmic protein LptC [Oculatella sp. LEGE 06141]|uniref:LPS export ABC transporter periplasmic protein LptC n=1 Tax=Oculatella sp. LEGE 06141 TaxID=1828648 RepID=UPI001880503B